ncbi:thioredoxin family protein [Oenococcus sicerae]|uniref:thioredoxin n=1 Tax=Oenococcus sicerae TaxID=2203724 RepID=UPI0010BB360A|nr:Thioredoxin [Oenococcus sicerae]
MAISVLDSDSFETATQSGVTVTDFWATWCTPCKIQTPILEKVSNELTDVKFGKIDVDKNQETANGLGVKAIPTLIIKKNGEVVDRIVGVHNQKQLTDIISQYTK